MKDINKYIFEKFKIGKDFAEEDDPALKEAYDFLVNLFNEEGVNYEINSYESTTQPGEKFIRVIITSKFLLDKQKANRYVGNINTTLHANKIKYRGQYPTINKKGNKKVSITILFYKKDKS